MKGFFKQVLLFRVMNWLFIALVAPLLWALSNVIDKYLVSKYFRSDTGTLVLYSSFIGLPLALLIAFVNPLVLAIEPLTALFVMLNSFLLIIYLFPYLRALSKADASVVVTLFQTIPVFSYLLALVLLGERISGLQAAGALVIIIGAVGISLEIEGRRLRIRTDVVLLQLCASFLIALNYALFKVFSLQVDFWTVSFWQYTGFFVFGLVLFVSARSYRERFIASVRQNRGIIIGLNAMNELINITGVVVFTYASLLAPLALLWAVNGFQPFFIFVLSAVAAALFPSIIREDLRRSVVVRKLIFMLVVLFGTYLISVV
jgi:uncharacterized membrane protein